MLVSLSIPLRVNFLASEVSKTNNCRVAFHDKITSQTHVFVLLILIIILIVSGGGGEQEFKKQTTTELPRSFLLPSLTPEASQLNSLSSKTQSVIVTDWLDGWMEG